MVNSLPWERLLAQGLARCGYYPTSLKIAEADICKVVGAIGNTKLRDREPEIDTSLMAWIFQ